tara:strand:+ start:1758 stop:2702 length:945 start_codon:yes stop_codon:yes gene_type:complete
MNILVTGGSGFKGSVLIPKLLKDGHDITSIDTNWFGDNLEENSHLNKIVCDIRDIDNIPMKGIDAIIHLANIANDPAVELNQSLSWEVNVLASQQLSDKAIRNGVQKIIYASSGSVYGIKEELKVTEDLPLLPISTYNKTKMVAERVFLSYKDEIDIICIRPATVCGYSPRMRLDVSVNMLTFQALRNKKITVFGGNQTRPNIHIKDMIDVYRHFLDMKNIKSGCYNAGFENISILDIANMVTKKINSEIVITESNDPRSYRQDSSKLLNTGFTPRYSVETAIDDVIEAYNSGKVKGTDESYTVKWMKKNRIGF